MDERGARACLWAVRPCLARDAAVLVPRRALDATALVEQIQELTDVRGPCEVLGRCWSGMPAHSSS